MLPLLPLLAGWSAGRPPALGGPAIRMAASNSALIIQNKGGGHGAPSPVSPPLCALSDRAAHAGEIGYHLALQLVSEKGMDVTILHEGPNKGKPPHNSYADLTTAGVKVVWKDDLGDAGECLDALDGEYGVVVDNWSKSPEAIKPYASAAQKWGSSQYCYVSSAGMYTPPKARRAHSQRAACARARVTARAGRLLGDHRGLRGQVVGPAPGRGASRSDEAAVHVLPPTVHLRTETRQVVPRWFLRPGGGRPAGARAGRRIADGHVHARRRQCGYDRRCGREGVGRRPGVSHHCTRRCIRSAS